MSSNITTISALPTPIRAEPRIPAGVEERSTRPAQSVKESPVQPDVTSSTPTEPLASQAAKPGSGLQESKSQETKSPIDKLQESKSQDPKALASMVDELNQYFKELPRTTHLQFTIDKKADQVVVKVMDVEQDKVIRQIPPEELLKLATSIKERIDIAAEELEQAALTTGKSASKASPLDSLLLRDWV
ncbi:MAG: flagellar protein FlaG [Synechococcaceae cyanobacterium SM1_2_3]|nr:flagellar protein FlaG [Synechococcaceae cyanobacterium SM1_2_3]